MPKSVDHQAKRDEVVAVATRLIAERGIDAATVRVIAAESGASTKVVSTHFSDKRELLLLVYRAAAMRARARLDAARLAPEEGVLACAEALLPLDRARRHDWALWLAFWGMAVSDSQFSAEQRQRLRSTRTTLHAVIEAATVAGELTAGTDAEALAGELLTTIHGIAVQAVFDPRAWPAERQRSMIRSRLPQR